MQEQNIGGKEIKEPQQLLLAGYDMNSAVQNISNLATEQSRMRASLHTSHHTAESELEVLTCAGELYTFSFKDAVFLLAKSQGSECGYENCLLCGAVQGYIYGAPP